MRLSIVSRATIAGAFILATAGCGIGTADGADRPVVVATTTQVGSIAAELGGDAIDLTTLLSPGVEAHDFELTPAQGAALERADMILVSGAGLEDWLDDALETTGSTDRVRDLSEGVELREPGEDEPTHGHDDEDGAHDDEDGAHDDEDGAHDDEDGHGHGDVDPHYWMSGPNAIVMVENARAALIEVAPDAADDIESRAEALIGRLEAADAEVRRLIGEIPEDRRKIVTDHDAVGYFVEEYGLEFVGSVFPTMDVSSEPSARDIETLVAQIRDAGVPAIFTESSVNPRLARAIANEAGARLVAEPIYTDSLGEEGSGAETLDGMLVHNATVFRDGLTGD
jgi:ABC-type Zn uptake system ZnuABC Zn-binding protein ZnuA